jgi:acetoin utilization protein AcuC
MGKPYHAVFIHSKDLENYSYPSDCPFITRRAAMTRETLANLGAFDRPDIAEREPTPATREEIETFHTARYLDVMLRAEQGDLDVEGLGMGLGTPDWPVFKGMYDYAALACGATLTAARLVAGGETAIAFNPSGGYHHAGPERAAGFCYINDVAIACLELATKGRRVFFLDLDVHHCDGVQDAFYDRSDVMTVSFHESGEHLFPGTGSVDDIGVREGKGYAVNVPLPPETYDEAYLDAFHAIAIPLLGAYEPDIIVLELGMDALSGDPLADLSLTNNAYARMVAEVRDQGRPLVVTGGGGYHAGNTARGWALAWSVLCGQDSGDEMHLGLGGVMLETTEWESGLRDRRRVTTGAQKRTIGKVVGATIEKVKANVFPTHGL